jgi:hypothetical protein
MLLEEEIAALNTQGVEIPARLLEVVSAIRDACGNALEVRDMLSSMNARSLLARILVVQFTAHCCAEE